MQGKQQKSGQAVQFGNGWAGLEGAQRQPGTAETSILLKLMQGSLHVGLHTMGILSSQTQIKLYICLKLQGMVWEYDKYDDSEDAAVGSQRENCLLYLPMMMVSRQGNSLAAHSCAFL